MGRGGAGGRRGASATTSTSSTTGHLPDQYEQSLPEVFPDFAPGSFTWDDELRGWVWTTFNDYQWDLNWANPAVLCEFADILLGLANLGVEVFRLDAIAFLWKRMGTTCQNQPEVHDLTQALRTVARIACPAVLFKAEAIVGPADLPAYLGVGDHAGKVCDLAYHNGLMVQVWSMLASGEVGLASHRAPEPPAAAGHARPGSPTCAATTTSAGRSTTTDAWRAGLDRLDAPALPLRLVRRLVPRLVGAAGWSSRRTLLPATAGSAARSPRSPGWRPATRMPSGADPAGHAVILGFGGVPVIWMGDELGLLNDVGWADEPAHAADNRWVHRPRMPWPVPDDTPTPAASVPAWPTCSTSAPRSPTCTPPAPPRSGTRATPACCSSSAAPRRARCCAAANMTDRPARVPGEVFHWLGLPIDALHDHLTDAAPDVARPRPPAVAVRRRLADRRSLRWQAEGMADPAPIVIVGGGLAAGTVATELRSGGYDGPIAVYTDEAHPPYERPPLSKDFMLDKGPLSAALVHPEDWYADPSRRPAHRHPGHGRRPGPPHADRGRPRHVVLPACARNRLPCPTAPAGR